MPKMKGRQAHSVIRIDSDVGRKHQAIASLIPAVEHMRASMDLQPDYQGMSAFLDDALSDLVSAVMDGKAIGISHLFTAVMTAPVQPSEGSIHLYSSPVTVAEPEFYEVQLANGGVVLVDAGDHAKLMEHAWLGPFTSSQQVHRSYRDGRKTVRQNLCDFLMSPSKGSRVEFVNGDKYDCRRNNLRIVKDAPLKP